MGVTVNHWLEEFDSLTRSQFYSECRQVVCRLVWDQDVECSIHSTRTMQFNKLYNLVLEEYNRIIAGLV
jgi:hypothetical protein